MSDDSIVIKKENLISHKKGKISKEYTLGKVIGKGAFGQVRLAIHKATKQKRAIKIMKKAEVNMQNLLDEISILSKLSHPNIMQIFEIFEDNINIYIVSEYCNGGELFDIISQKGSFTEKEACIVMKQLISGICYCHQKGIVHRDLKPENILMEDKSGDLSLKIIDWGCAKTIKNKERLHQADGTAYYIAPEVLKNDYDEKCDVWSCGIIFYILLCGYPPFNGDTDEEIFQAILREDVVFPEEEWDSVSVGLKLTKKKLLLIRIWPRTFYRI